MKAVRLHAFHQMPVVDEVPEPASPRPARRHRARSAAPGCAAPTCTSWRASGTRRWTPPLPYILGHENAGWVHEVGSAVTNVAVGDTVILHPKPTCGLCRACRAGEDMHCVDSAFPGLSTRRRHGRVPADLGAGLHQARPADPPQDVAALADAGITAYHAVRKALPLLYPGTTFVVIGAGGLGHIGIQCLAALTATKIIVVDRNPDALKLAEQLGAHHTVVADGARSRGRDLTGGRGAEVVLDFVAEQGAETDGWAMTGGGRHLLRHRLRRHAARSRRWTSSRPSATSSATSWAPTTTSPS